MEAKKQCLCVHRSQSDRFSGEEYRLFEEWYRGCEQDPGLLEQLTGAEREALRERQLVSIIQNLSLQKNKLVLVVI